MSVDITSIADSDEFDLRRNYQDAIGCLLQCRSVLDDLQERLASKDETIASLEGRIVRMSLELASLKAFEDVHRSKRRVVSNVDFADDYGDGGSDAGSYQGSYDGSYQGSYDGSREPVAGSASSMDASIISASARSLDVERRLSVLSLSWGGPDSPALDVGISAEASDRSYSTRDERLAVPISLDNSISRKLEVRRGGRRRESTNWNCATQETDRHVIGEREDARNNNRDDYKTLWQSCVNLQNKIQRSSFYLEQVMTGWEPSVKRMGV